MMVKQPLVLPEGAQARSFIPPAVCTWAQRPARISLSTMDLRRAFPVEAVAQGNTRRHDEARSAGEMVRMDCVLES